MPFRFTNHSLCLCASPKAAQAGMHHEKGTVPKLVCLQGTFCEARAPTHASLHMQSPRNEEPASIAVVIERTFLIFSRENPLRKSALVPTSQAPPGPARPYRPEWYPPQQSPDLGGPGPGFVAKIKDPGWNTTGKSCYSYFNALWLLWYSQIIINKWSCIYIYM